LIQALQKLIFHNALANIYMKLISVLAKKLVVNGMHNFPNSANIVVQEFLPAQRFFSFLDTRSLPTAHIRCTVGCFWFVKGHFHAVVTSSSFEI